MYEQKLNSPEMVNKWLIRKKDLNRALKSHSIVLKAQPVIEQPGKLHAKMAFGMDDRLIAVLHLNIYLSFCFFIVFVIEFNLMLTWIFVQQMAHVCSTMMNRTLLAFTMTYKSEKKWLNFRPVQQLFQGKPWKERINFYF